VSLDLFFWDPPADSDDDDVRARYERYCDDELDDEDEAAGESARIRAFYEALVGRFPDHDIGRVPLEQRSAGPV
jgi:hypothetical protein